MPRESVSLLVLAKTPCRAVLHRAAAFQCRRLAVPASPSSARPATPARRGTAPHCHPRQDSSAPPSPRRQPLQCPPQRPSPAYRHFLLTGPSLSSCSPCSSCPSCSSCLSHSPPTSLLCFSSVSPLPTFRLSRQSPKRPVPSPIPLGPGLDSSTPSRSDSCDSYYQRPRY